MVGDGEERERDSVWATQGEREAVGGLGDGEERERKAVGMTEGERERNICLASARREREETKRMDGDCQK
ncbi:hypothetical protein TIFTF001_045107 [Ficus carica]|uniref:Uncharacterized protein n=1 Tax=Ficus carica TaxID=3494 RepID=A0AA87Z551_FICCA|nr:hypothetical protein TIFTF001_045107 [Ficus carica]